MRTAFNFIFYRIQILPIFYLLILLSGCKNEYDYWQTAACEYAKSENKLTQKEYEDLMKKIQDSKGEFNNLLKDDGDIDHEKVRRVLIKRFNKDKLSILENDIYDPNSSNKKEINKFNVNVYLENSASMDGYVNGKTEFETAIYSLLGDIKISDFSDSLNLNYINKSIHKVGPDIEDFIDKLEPSSFRMRGGDRSTSDLSDVLKSVLSSVDKRDVSILISDFVFSPGKIKGLSARDYLNNQMLGIKINFAETLKKQNISVVVLQLYSNFNGIYYDLQDNQHKYDGKRPYYVWVIGQDEQVKTILDSKILDNIKGGISNKLVLNNVGAPSAIKYKIAMNHKKGDFKLKNGAQGPITGAEYGSDRNKGIFGFVLYADFSNEMQNANFYLDKSNFKYNANYTITISLIEQSDKKATAEYTHKFEVETKDLKSETFKLEVIGKTPNWVLSSSSDDDRAINSSNPEGKKTFGLQYLIDGVSEAYYPLTKKNVINKLEFSISR